MLVIMNYISNNGMNSDLPLCCINLYFPPLTCLVKMFHKQTLTDQIQNIFIITFQKYIHNYLLCLFKLCIKLTSVNT
jgi:hypothetical protein